jgi:glycosyltransferase involved in cell wall biosynthesis
MPEITGKRVLILLQNEPVPSDRHVWNESRALVRAGYDVTVICPTGERRDRASFEEIEGVTIHRYEPRPAGDRAFEYMLEYLAALRSIRRLARRLGRERPFDLVHACSPPDFLLLAALGLRRQGARFVFDHHDLTPELYRTRFGAGLLHRITLIAEQVAFRSADVVLSVNDSYRRIAIERGHLDPADVAVVRTGPDLKVFRPGAPDPTLKRGKDHLLSYVGVMGPQDGVDQALHALAALRNQRKDWHAIFMGDGDVIDEMRRLTDELGLSDQVEFTGWVEHDTITRVLSTSDVCLAPDPQNPLNDVSSMVKISEYMAIGRPIVSYDLAESRFAAGEAAAFAAPQNHAEFAQLVSELLDDPGRRAAMGAAGRARAEGHLAWEHQERSMLAAYSRALAMGPAREGRLGTLLRILVPHRPDPGAGRFSTTSEKLT